MLPLLALAFMVGFISSVVGEKNTKTNIPKTHKQRLQKTVYDFEMKLIPQEKEMKTTNYKASN